MTFTKTKVLRPIEPPKPVTQVHVRHVDEGKRVIRFAATQPAINEIDEIGLGILRQKDGKKSGWCALIVNDCFDFDEVVAWMYEQEEPESAEVAA